MVHPHPSICRSNPLTIGKFPRTLKEAILEVLLILLGGGPCDYCVAPVQRIGILDFLDLVLTLGQDFGPVGTRDWNLDLGLTITKKHFNVDLKKILKIPCQSLLICEK